MRSSRAQKGTVRPRKLPQTRNAATWLDTALKLLDRGMVPTMIARGKKRPWAKGWPQFRPTREHLELQYQGHPHDNVGVLLGPGPATPVIAIDLDGEDARPVCEHLFPGLLDIVTPAWRSKRGEQHLFRWDDRFAGLPGVMHLDQNGHIVTTKVANVEVRLGPGEQSVMPPSTTDGFTREWIHDLDTPIASFPEQFVPILLAAKKPPKPSTKGANVKVDCGPWTFETLLTKHGWTKVNETQYRRPDNGSPTGNAISGSIIAAEDGMPIFHCFSSNAAPLVAGGNYNLYQLLAYLEHGGDFKAAREALNVKGPTPAQTISGYAADVFRSPTGDLYATFAVNGHNETVKIESKAFAQWLAYQFYRESGKPPGAEQVAQAVNVYAARARYDAPVKQVYTRVAGIYDDTGRLVTIYIDLGDPEWRAIQITADGCAVINNPPVTFVRPSSLLPLPVPDFTGSIQELRPFVNMTDADFTLLSFVLCSCLRPKGPFTILMLESRSGSGKTTTLRMLRSLFDPNASDVRGMPEKPYDVFLAAANSYCLVIDNVSTMPEWLADALCMIATKGGYGTRALYGQDAEKIIDAVRPIMLGTIVDLTTREDFLSRAIMLSCLPLDRKTRRLEDELQRSFAKAQPKILGALCKGASAAMANWETVKPSGLPRMADFAHWAVASESGLGYEPGTFERLYLGNQSSVADKILETPLPQAIIAYIDKKKEFDGTASELYDEIAPRMRGSVPKNPQVLSRRLKRLVGTLPLTIIIEPHRIQIRRVA